MQEPQVAQLSSAISQKIKYEGKEQRVKIEQNDLLLGLANDDGKITVKESGVYFYIAAPQVGAKHRCDKGYADFWLRVNGADVANTNVRLTFKDFQKDVIVSQGLAALNAGDVVTVHMSGSCGVFIEAIKPSKEPLIPSIIFTMYKTA